MGAKKLVTTPAKQTTTHGSMKARLRPPAKVGRAKITSKKAGSPTAKRSKSADKTSLSQSKREDTKESSQRTEQIPKSTTSKTIKKSKDSGSTRSTSPKKSPLRQKPADHKSKAIKKVIKSLDIKISGFKTIVPDEEKVECKASISEIVKTTSRAASAKVSPGPLGKKITSKRDDEVVRKLQPAGSLSIEVKKQETKEVKLYYEETRKGKDKEMPEGCHPVLKEVLSKVGPGKIKDENKSKLVKLSEVKLQLPKVAREGITKLEEVYDKSKIIHMQSKKFLKFAVEKNNETKSAEKIPVKPAEKNDPKMAKESLKLEKNTSPKATIIKDRPKVKPKPQEKSVEPSKIYSKGSVNPTTIISKPGAQHELQEPKNPAKIYVETIGKETDGNRIDASLCTPILETPNEIKLANVKKALFSSAKSNTGGCKLLSVRERLQKKYVRDKGSTFKAFKATKQVKAIEKNCTPEEEMKESEDAQSPEPSPLQKSVNTTAKQEKDIYDFKTESESEDNIKMNLLSESAVLSKIHLDKNKDTNKELEDNAKEAKVKQSDEDKDFSDEDDRPLQMTKKLLDNAKDEDEKPLSQCMDLKPMPIKIKEEVKVEPKKPVKISTKVAKTKPVKKPPPKRKERIESSNSFDSGSEDSDDASSESCHDFGPKRHRMASLNALAKVQCLYENESRTAHELGLSKSSQIPKIRIIASSSSSDEEENAAKKIKLKADEPKETEKDEDSAPEKENKRELRNAPGLRGMGKHWDFNDGSSFESGHESDITFRRDDKAKTKKRKIVKAKAVTKLKEKAEPKPKKPVVVKAVKKKPKQSFDSSDDDSKSSSTTSPIDSAPSKKRKRDKVVSEVKTAVLASKRMASLNASAIVAATYEVERHLDRNLDSDCSSFESFPEILKVQTTKKIKDAIKADPADEANKEGNRPTSSSVVIVQDTDVTITGVYVNSTTGSSQEAYCKMQYRVQSSVTEERVLRPNSIDPPKSYTPLGALSSMRPPGATAATTTPLDDLTPPLQQQTFQPTIINHEEPVPAPQPNAHIYPPQLPPHHHHHSQLTSQEPMLHLHHQPTPKYHHMHHQQPPLVQPRCESPLRYPHGVYQTVQPPMPPPPNSISISGGGSSAFCAPMHQSHHDLSGYYQPAGPLISPHVLPTLTQSNAAPVSTKQLPSPIESDQLQQPPQSTSTAESSDSEVLITGGDLSTFRYPTHQQPQQHQPLSSLSASQQQQQQHQQQNSPYSRPIHPMHYTAAYPPSYYSPYPSDAMCYSPPYQPYYPAKVYQSAPTYRRYPSYYQAGPPPPNELYDPQPHQSNAPQPPPPQTGSQLVPSGPSGPQHIEHYPGPPGFYTGYSPGGGQCYSRGMQPPYMEYPAPCPCPMQSCPKNVHTGPLIGSNNSGSNSNSNTISSSNSASNITTSNSSSSNSISNSNTIISNSSSSLNNLSQQLKSSKGPVKTHSHHMVQHEPPQSNLSNGQAILSKSHNHHQHLHQCKMEIMQPLKSEMKTDMIGDTITSTGNRKTGQYEETVVPPSTYTVNDKLDEPEATPSPARGSTGLPTTVPDQNDNSAAQVQSVMPLVPVNLSQPSNTLIALHQVDSEANCTNMPSVIGRKARIGKTMAREMMYGAHAMHNLHHPHSQAFNNHPHLHHRLPSHSSTSEANKSTLPEPFLMPIAIKPELDRVKKEEIKMEEEDDVVILEEEVKDVKSEPESVEVLDKSSDLEVIECTDLDGDDSMRQPNSKRMKILDNKSQCKKSPSNGYKSLIKQTEPKPYLCLSRKSDKRNYFRKYSKLGSKNGIRKRQLMLTEQQKKRLSIRKRNLIKMEKKRQAASSAKSSAKAAATAASQIITSYKEDSFSCSSKLNKFNSPPNHTNDSRGYFSEPDVRSLSSRKAKKSRSSETRSKSETKKSLIRKVTTIEQSGLSKLTPKLPENSNKGIIPKASKKTSKCFKIKSKSQLPSDEDAITNRDTDQSNEPSTSYPSGCPNTIGTTRSTSNNNNDFFEHNNNNTMAFRCITTSTTCRVASAGNGKRSRARGSRFGNKKRPKIRHYQTEVDDSIIPRKTNAVPKWNNGWSWNGAPFQGKVFLNSDDPLVIRTCYPAMQHSEGDVIRPRDCVLLRAGSKKNELPYVAKVAHLWENPEDGEMMMSLLWYYRPEHTEQGRQHNDSSDEVFASRHRDHNSVACIEDKCYVLRFSEYCRYRRRVRAAEEGIEENQLVPLLKTFSHIPKVPVTTNPEQVMFCQRVYEFRLKRLMKTSSS